MRAQWHALHANFVRASNRLSFQAEFQKLQRGRSALQGFPDPSALLGFLHAPGSDGPRKNAILRDLVQVAQSAEPEAETGMVLLFLALWPGLDAVHCRLRRHYRSEPDQLVSDIAAQVSRTLRILDLGRVTWIAATVIRNVERDIRRHLAAIWADVGRRTDTTDLADQTSGIAFSPFGLPEGIATEEALTLLSTRLEALIGKDALLVLRVAVCGELQRDVAVSLGVPYEVARKRYRRALAKLLQKLSE